MTVVTTQGTTPLSTLVKMSDFFLNYYMSHLLYIYLQWTEEHSALNHIICSEGCGKGNIVWAASLLTVACACYCKQGEAIVLSRGLLCHVTSQI